MVLIIGASGFVGKHILAHFLKDGHKVVAPTRNALEYRHHNLNNVIINDVSDISSSNFHGGVDYVIYLAGLAHESLLFSDENEIRRVNEFNVLRIATLACNAGIKKFIFLSSANSDIKYFKPRDNAIAGCKQ